MKFRRFAAVFLIAAAFTGCGQQTEGSSAPEQPAYDGPLYEVTLTSMEEKLGEQGRFRINPTGINLSNNRNEIVFVEGLTADNTYCYYAVEQQAEDGSMIAWRKFCDNNFEPLPIEGYRSFLGAKDGYRFFLYTPSSDGSDYAYELYDPDCNLVCSTFEDYEISIAGPQQIYLERGQVAATERASGRSGFLDLYTGEWTPLPEGCSVYGAAAFTEMDENMVSFYSEGLAPAMAEDPVRIYNPNSSAQHAEYNVLGFVDESGQFVFRFADQPQFAGKIINEVTGFLDGSCVISGREPGSYYIDSSYVEPDLYQRDFYWRIDTAGNPIEEVDYETLCEFRAQVLAANGVVDDPSDGCYYKESIRIADGLTLTTVNPVREDNVVARSELAGYALTDANGTVYPLDAEIKQIFVGDDGTVLLDCKREAALENPEENHYSIWYRLDYQWIAPEGFALPEEEGAQLEAGESETMREHLAKVREIMVMPNLTPAQKPVFTVTSDTIDYTYASTVHDSMYMEGTNPETEGTVFFYLYTLSDEELTIAVDWTDADGSTHRGYYTGGDVLSDTPAPCLND